MPGPEWGGKGVEKVQKSSWGQVRCVHSDGVAPTAAAAWSLSVFITAWPEDAGSLTG